MADHLSIKKVAVIGSGISGVAAAAHLLAEGLDVTVFERNREAGGVWLYDERPPIEPVYPSTKPSQGEVPGHNDEQTTDSHALKHAPPGPCYAGLKNNVSTPLLRTTLNAWPEGTPDIVNHRVIKEYIQTTSKKTGVHNVTKWGARVIDLQKEGDSWKVTWSVLNENSDKPGEEEELSELFDAVVVASGHYHAPRVPDLPGLANLKTKWPSRVLHSKSYRRPDAYAGKNILLIGGGVSSTDIARELGPVAQNIYQSTRNGPFDLPESALPANGSRVNEISSFERTEKDTPDELSSDDPLPVTVHLKSTDQTIQDIHHIILCTGYHITLPFLARYHEDETLSDNASDTVLVTDGNQVHNLHKDIFYIPDPTLAFIGVPYYTATFTLFEFQAIVVAAAFSGIANLPTRAAMRREYEDRVRIKGSGRGFHSLKDSEEIYVKDILNWVNSGRESKGLPHVQGHTDSWIAAKAIQKERHKELFGIA